MLNDGQMCATRPPAGRMALSRMALSRMALSRLALSLLAISLLATSSRAADYFAGRNLTIVVGNDVGGGFDAYARLFSRHLPRVVPGQPGVVVQNMPGAGSATATAYIYRVAPKDGTYIGAITPGAIVAPLFDDRTRRQYDPDRLVYLTSADSGSRLCVTWHQSAVRNVSDAKRLKAVIGAAGAGSSSSDYAKLHRATSGLNFEIVSGYKGTADILLAMERREVDGFCGVDWASLTSQRPDWIRDGKVNLLFEVGVKPNPELTARKVPLVWDSTISEQARAVVELVTSQQDFARPYIMAPDTPPEAVSILRAAFAQLYEDEKFRADAEKSGLILTPIPGESVQMLVGKLYAAPKAIVDSARDILK
jgi:tripartite-type tricarboxylate transporter receptor subunit TctC